MVLLRRRSLGHLLLVCCERYLLLLAGVLALMSIRMLSGWPTDCGIAQLAMHSVRETAGADDFDYSVRLFEKLYKRAGELIKEFE